MRVVLLLCSIAALCAVASAVETAATCGARTSCSSCSLASACGWCPTASKCVHQAENPCFGMKLGCTDDKLEVELKSDDSPFVVEADLANSTKPIAPEGRKIITFKSKTTNTPDADVFNSSDSKPWNPCEDLNKNGICDNVEKRADPCAGKKKCEYVEADVIDTIQTPRDKNSSWSSSSSDDRLKKSDIKQAIARAEEKLEKKAEQNGGIKCEGEVCRNSTRGLLDAINGLESNSTRKMVKQAIKKAERKLEEKAADQNPSGSKSSRPTGSRTESSGEEVKREILRDLQQSSSSFSFSFNGTNSTDDLAAKINQVKAVEDKKIQKTKEKLKTQSARLNATIAKEESLADRIDQLSAQISSIQDQVTKGGSSGSPVDVIAEAVKKVKSYFRKALKD